MTRKELLNLPEGKYLISKPYSYLKIDPNFLYLQRYLGSSIDDILCRISCRLNWSDNFSIFLHEDNSEYTGFITRPYLSSHFMACGESASQDWFSMYKYELVGKITTFRDGNSNEKQLIKDFLMHYKINKKNGKRNRN